MGPHRRGRRGAGEGALALRRQGGTRRRDRGAAGGMVSGAKRTGLVLAREGGRFRVATDEGEIVAVLRGKARRDAHDRVVVGDRVVLDEGDAALGIAGIAGVERSEEHTSELQSHSFISYAVFCLKKR